MWKNELGLLRDRFHDPWDDSVACEWRSDDLKQKVFRKRHTSRSRRLFRSENQILKQFINIIKTYHILGINVDDLLKDESIPPFQIVLRATSLRNANWWNRINKHIIRSRNTSPIPHRPL